jgi:ubiquinone/menaquinone biosynthesis C-methylase UbiE
MSLMDIPETERVLAEVFRVLRPGGFFQFSITHPCFDTPHRRKLRDETGRTYAIEVGDYFSGREGEVKEWLFFAAPLEVRKGLSSFRTPVFMRILSSWLNRLVEAGSCWSASANRFLARKRSVNVPGCKTRRSWPTFCTSGRENRQG